MSIQEALIKEKTRPGPTVNEPSSISEQKNQQTNSLVSTIGSILTFGIYQGQTESKQLGQLATQFDNKKYQDLQEQCQQLDQKLKASLEANKKQEKLNEVVRSEYDKQV